jgi:tRNA1Val (adenine37-N6)-methyltransferase
VHTDVLQFDSTKKYDCIISNPPFFEGDLKSPDSKRNAAMHGNTLGLEQLLPVVKKYVTNAGFFAVLLPFHRLLFFEKAAAAQELFLSKKVLVKQTDAHACFRGILFFSPQPAKASITELTIKTEENKYSEGFISLLKDYYLHL